MTLHRSILAILCALVQFSQSEELKPKYAPAPVANPLKGLVLHAGSVDTEKFPHSMEFSYFGLSDLVVGKREYRWDVLEKRLGEISGRGHQTVMRVFVECPKKTPAVLRYPRGKDDDRNAGNASRLFGYHDDSFAWGALEDGSEWDSSFVAHIKTAGAQEKWRRYPIGGEIRSEAWGIVFDRNPADPKVQDFADCVRQTHESWLMDSGLFSDKTWTEERRKHAEEQVRRIGYEFHVPSVELGETKVTMKVENRGVAPFYVEWPIGWAVLDKASGNVIRTVKAAGALAGIMPGDKAERSAPIKAKDLSTGQFLAIRVPNPMKNGLPLRFANKTQDQHAKGWLTLVDGARCVCMGSCFR